MVHENNLMTVNQFDGNTYKSRLSVENNPIRISVNATRSISSKFGLLA